MKPIRRKFSAETKALEDSRSLIVTISTPTPDRSGDVVEPKGAKLDHFLKNPVVLFGHKYNEPPVARADELVVTDDSIKAKVTFPAEGVYAFADAIYGLYKAGIMNAWSIGFQSDHAHTESLPGGGLKFNEWELLEFSAVPVPANPEALTILRSKGISEEEIKEVTEEEVEEPVEESSVETKDIGETVALARIIDDLNWLIWAFEQNDVSEESTTRMKEALVVLLDVLKTQAEIGKKEFPIDRSKEAPAFPEAQPQAEQPDATAALKSLRDALKPADKSIGLVLRSLKTLLDQPKQEGGEN